MSKRKPFAKLFEKPAPWAVTPEMEEIFKEAGIPAIVTGDPHKPSAKVIRTVRDIDVDKGIAEERETHTLYGHFVVSHGDMADFSMLKDDDSEDDDDESITDDDIEYAAHIAAAQPRQGPYSMFDATEEEAPVSENPYNTGDILWYRPGDGSQGKSYRGTVDKVYGDMVYIKLDSSLGSGVNRVGCKYDSECVSADQFRDYVTLSDASTAIDPDRLKADHPPTSFAKPVSSEIVIPIDNGAVLIDKNNGTVFRIKLVDANDVVIENVAISSSLYIPASLVSALGRALGEL